jgi:protoporphyrinogen oxidase
MSQQKTAVVIGAGPAGLTAALELCRRTDLRVVVLEATDAIGGISQTVVHEGNRIDIGGHRFFSKSDRVMDWWLDVLPPEAEAASGAAEIAYQGKTREVRLNGHDVAPEAAAMMLRPRLSRIVHGGHFFDYPISLSPDTLRKLGLGRTARIGASYVRQRLRRRKPIETLEDFFIDRFGHELYATFFRDYTEKVWGVPCSEIPAEWGAQRVKGLSVTTAVLHFLRNIVGRDKTAAQKGTETSLIERFLYPRRGPGEMWEAVAGQVRASGGEIRMNARVDGLTLEDGRITRVSASGASGDRVTIEDPALVVSTMPLRSLVRCMDGPVAPAPREVAEGLVYRDFLIVGLLLDRLAGATPQDPGWLRDNWIYIQEPGVRAGRLQVFNNWSPYMVADPTRAWVGAEYFVNEGDDLWEMADSDLRTFASGELESIGLARTADVRGSVVVRMPKAYPAYFGTYDRFGELREWLDGVENLAPVGRNGMHRYNNQDHSMLTAMTVVDQWVAGRRDPSAVWAVNAEEDYHEEK